MNFGSLFTGIGGFDLGFERAGLSGAWQVEWDKDCQKVLSRHFPNAKRFTDVRSVTGRTGKGWNRYGQLRAVDVICGGFPCQDLSVAGHRRGLAGERSGLWFEFHRLIVELRPRLVVIENVPGLLSSNRGEDFAVLLAGLTGVLPEVPAKGWKNAGFGRGFFYNVAWRVLDAQYFGVPQRRRRVFIVASFGNGSSSEILFEPESVFRHPAPRREAGQETPAVAGTLSANRGGTERPAGNANELDFCIPVASTLRANDHGGHRGDGADNLIPSAFDVRNLELGGEVSGTLQSKKSGGYSLNYTNPVIVPMAFQQNTRDEVRFIGGDGQIVGALAAQSGAKQTNYIAYGGGNTSGPIEVSTALTTSNQRLDFDHETFLHQVSGAGNFGVRRLMPVECERLQGFPDCWTDGQTDSARYRQLGNAVAVPVAEWLGHRIKTFLR